MIDTNIAIRLRDDDSSIRMKLARLTEPVIMSIITRVELEGGVVRHAESAALRKARLVRILEAIPSVPFDDPCADAYAKIVAGAGYSRRKLLDRMIAAQAIVHRARVVTTNQADFADVPGLNLESWE